MTRSADLRVKMVIVSTVSYAAGTAAAKGYGTNGGSILCSRRAIAKMPQQRQPPVLLPRLRHYGGCSRVYCRILWRKSRQLVARPVLAAARFGDKIANFANHATR